MVWANLHFLIALVSNKTFPCLKLEFLSRVKGGTWEGKERELTFFGGKIGSGGTARLGRGQEEVLLASAQESEMHPQTQRCFAENAVLDQLYALFPVSPMVWHNLFLPHVYFPFTFHRTQKISVLSLFVLIWYTLVKQNTAFLWWYNYLFSNHFQGCLGPCIVLEWDTNVTSPAQILTGREPKINHNCS